MLCGSKGVIGKVFHFRQMIGDQIRQVGITVGAGFVALERMTHHFQDDHASAFALAHRLAETSGLRMDSFTVETDIVFCSLAPSVG